MVAGVKWYINMLHQNNPVLHCALLGLCERFILRLAARKRRSAHLDAAVKHAIRVVKFACKVRYAWLF